MDTQRQTVSDRITLGRACAGFLDEFGIVEGRCSLSELFCSDDLDLVIRGLQIVSSNVKAIGYQRAALEIYKGRGGDITYEVSGIRPETDEEINTRLAREARSAELASRHRLEQFRRLQAEFGDEGISEGPSGGDSDAAL